jgi:hypothetical protein
MERSIVLCNPVSFLAPKRLLDYLVLQVCDLELTCRRLFQIRFMCTCLGIYVFTRHNGNQYMDKSAENQMRSNLELLPVMNIKSRPQYISAIKKVVPEISLPK